jgi:predicted glutamine amidotransferase
MKRILIQHLIELEDLMGGDGNGIYVPGTSAIYKNMYMSKLLEKHFDTPCMIHTRRATGDNVNTENSHPFVYKGVVLMHNGWAEDFLEPQNKPDSFNLLHYWRDHPALDLMDLKWVGNIIFYDVGSKMIWFYLKKVMMHVVLDDGTVIATSQLTPALEGNIKWHKEFGPGIYYAKFFNNFINSLDAKSNRKAGFEND